jgi:DnaJ-class molecular chaperone
MVRQLTTIQELTTCEIPRGDSILPLDCYEVMQISPNANPDAISRVYRMLALRYHPDNAETGNSEKFIRLSEAYQILSDPEKRASYDMRHRDAMRLLWEILFELPKMTDTSAGSNMSLLGMPVLFLS